MELDLRHLRALIAVSETGSINQAAIHLGVSQPQLSRTLNQLERAVGQVLLERGRSGTELSAQGEHIVSMARNAVSAFEIAVTPAVLGRSVTVGYTWSALGKYTKAVFRRWEIEAPVPGIGLTLKRFGDETGGVDSGRADIAIVRSHAPTVAKRSLLFAERRVGAFPDGHRLAGLPAVQLSDYEYETIILNQVSGSTTKNLWADKGIVLKKPELLVSSIDEWNHLVSLGKGVGVTPESTRKVHPYPGIHYVNIVDAPPAPVWLVWENEAFSDVAQTLTRLVHDEVESARRR